MTVPPQRNRRRSSRLQQRLGYCLATGSLGLIALFTLIPDPKGAAFAAATPLQCIVCGSLGGVDVLLNVLLFVPLGIGLGLAGFSWRRALLLAGILSFCVELLQMKVIAGRDASLGDLLTNTGGGVIGALVGAHWRQIVFPARADARRLALALALLSLCVWVATAWAFGPNLPRSAPWYGQWAPDLGNYRLFPGKVLTLSAGGEPLLPGIAINQERLKDALSASPSVGFTAVLGPPPQSLAPIGAIHDAWQRQVILLGQDRTHLAFRVSMKGSGLKLRVPTVSLKNGMAGQAGDTVEASGALRNGVFELNSRIEGHIRTRRLPLSASWGWSLITPWDSVLGEEVRALTALWISALLALLTYWSLRAGGLAVGIAPMTTGILLLVVPLIAQFPKVHWTEWVAATVGMVIGSAAAHSTKSTSPPVAF